MPKSFDRNREALIRLIYVLGTFTELELLEKFRTERGDDIAIDGQQTLRMYLDELVSIGALTYEWGKYTVVYSN